MKNKIICLFFSLFTLISLITVVCSAEGVCPQSSDGEHNIITITAKDATCTERGNSEYNICTRCGKYFADNNGTVEIDGSAVFTPAKGHTWNTLQEKSGHYKKCSVCGQQEAKESHRFSDWVMESENGGIQIKSRTCDVCGYKESMSTQIVTVPTVTEHVHKPIKIEQKEPTCTEPGNITYYKCDECGKLFSDERCTQETQLQVLEIAATGHHFDTLEYNDAGHWRQCACGEKLETEPHDICSQILTSKDGFGNKIHVKREYCSECEYEKFSNIDDDAGVQGTAISVESTEQQDESGVKQAVRKIMRDKIILLSASGVCFLILVFLIKKYVQFRKKDNKEK